MSENPKKRGGRRTVLSVAERANVVALSLAGVNQTEIARRMGRSREAVNRALSSEEAKAALEIARSTLVAGSTKLARDWLDASGNAAQRGDHRPALDALERLKVVDPPRDKAAGPGFTVRIGVMLPGLPRTSQLAMKVPEPAIDASAVEPDASE